VAVEGSAGLSGGNCGLEKRGEMRYYHGMTETVSFKLERGLLVKIDGLANNRSDFIRAAVEEKIRRSTHKGRSVWETFSTVKGLNLDVRPVRGKVKRVQL
jgi:hypothetical protein